MLESVIIFMNKVMQNVAPHWVFVHNQSIVDDKIESMYSVIPF